MADFTFEVCIDSVASACAAEAGGGNRLELCDNLVEGGTTPSIGMVESVLAHCRLPLMAIIRPRGGDFLYSDWEFESMKRNIAWMKKAGIHGVVLGILQANGTVDLKRNQALIEIARPLKVTFHRAFDMTRDPFEALDALFALGVDSLLTSGQAETAFEGRKLIQSLQERAEGNIVIMPGGGIDESNIGQIVSETGVSAIHASGRTQVKSKMGFRKENVFMGHRDFPEYSSKVASPKRISEMRKLALAQLP